MPREISDIKLCIIGAQLLAIGRGCLHNGDAAQCRWSECAGRGRCSVSPSENDFRMAAKLMAERVE